MKHTLKTRVAAPLLALALALPGLAYSETPEAALPAGDAFAPWAASYKLSRGPLTLGYADFALTEAASGDCYQYRYAAKPVGLARLFIGQLTEVSDFCVADGEILPKRYSFGRADKKEDNYTLLFDQDASEVRGPGKQVRPLPESAMDRLLIQIAVRDFLVGHEPAGTLPTEPRGFTMVEDDRIKTYTLQVMGHERVKTPAGEMDAIRVERIKDPRKTTLFWLSPELGYIPVRVEQRKDGDEELSLALNEIPAGMARPANAGEPESDAPERTGPRRR